MIGEQLGDWIIEQELGEGGMGVVYRAIDDAGQRVAIKRLHAEVAQDPKLVARFEREVAAHSALTHPHIADLVSAGTTDDGHLFLVMEFVPGGSVADRLDFGPIDPGTAVRLGEQVLSALHHAHQFGFIHRDLKPENVLLNDMRAPTHAKVIDFGLVKMMDNVFGAEHEARLTTTGMVFGTPQYMAPEQIALQTVDARTDLYAFGIVLFEMLTGHQPFQHEEVTDLWRAHLNEPPPSVAGYGMSNDVAAEFDSVLGGLLAKNPDDRFSNASAARRALTHIMGTPA